VDGTHCPIEEPRHPTLSKNPQFFSHKTHSSALNYEIGLSIFHSNIVWVNGPFPAGTPDLMVYRMENGLREKIPEGKRVVGDMGYQGEPGTVSIRNRCDDKGVKKFKSRARSRHETVNGRLKTFSCLKHVFHHNRHSHKKVFEAICVIVQYQMEIGSPLFDV
jgi:DDE superfamily endonuclease